VLRAGEGGTSMQAQLTKLDAAENNLKRLMAEVTRSHGEGAGSRREDLLQDSGHERHTQRPG